jgi:cytochrome c553
MKIKKGKSKKGSKDFIENVGCEACHGAGEGYIKVKKNYKKKGKDAFKKLLKEDPMAARKAQYDAGLIVAGINTKTIKEQCLTCHWEKADDKDKCPKCDKDDKGKDIVMDFKKYRKADDHRDHDEIDDVLAKMSDADKKKWKGYIEQDSWFKTKPPNAK